MSQFHLSPRLLRVSRPHPFATSGLMRRLFLLCLPLPLLALAALFAHTHYTVEQTVNSSIARNSQILAQSIGFTISQTLLETRNQVAALAAGSFSLDEFRHRLQRRLHALNMLGDNRFCEAAFMGLGKEANNRFLWINSRTRGLVTLSPDLAENQSTSPFYFPGRQPGEHEVVLSNPTEVSYTLGSPEQGARSQITLQLVRFSTPVVLANGSFAGYLILGMDITFLRDMLSRFVLSFDAGDMQPLAVYVDNAGWMIFQSGQHNALAEEQPGAQGEARQPAQPGGEVAVPALETLATIDSGRAGFRGDFGRAGYSQAFRPSGDYYGYWTMMNDIQANKPGQLSPRNTGWSSSPVECVSYAAVTYNAGGERGLDVVGGIMVLDPSFTASLQGQYLRKSYAVAALAALLLLAISMLVTARIMRKSLITLRKDIDGRGRDGHASPLPERTEPKEVHDLRQSINVLLADMRDLQDERDMENSMASARRELEPVPRLPLPQPEQHDGITGVSPVIKRLRMDIAQAAKVQADVLVMGETGTGKELVSRAIHTLSACKDGPFITINCGALDENLLMDSLFGHVKGAFTEARQGRKGAFLTAEGGTLMLDEIGNASPRVQQALLRALSDRCIHPLGSDTTIPFSTRVIAATNADLQEEIKKGTFREDLYFRLAVFTVHTPPLREHKMDIPYLLATFLQEACAKIQKPVPRVSRGALSTLMHYHWPGNVRELRNTVFRTLARCEGDLIQTSHLRLGSEDNLPLTDIATASLAGASPLSASEKRVVSRWIREIPPQASRETSGKTAQPSGKGAAPQQEEPASMPAPGQMPPAGSQDTGAPATPEPVRSPVGSPAETAAADTTTHTVSDKSTSRPATPPAHPDPSPAQDQDASRPVAQSGAQPESPAAAQAGKPSEELSPRVRAALPRLAAMAKFTRQDYQEATNVSQRTAQYDLQELVRQGVLGSEGRGRAMRYFVKRNHLGGQS